MQPDRLPLIYTRVVLASIQGHTVFHLGNLA